VWHHDAGRLVGEELLQSEYLLADGSMKQAVEASKAPDASVAGSAGSWHVQESGQSTLKGPFSRPMTPTSRRTMDRRRAGTGDAHALAQSDSALTMRARAEKAAMHVPGKSAVKAEEYVEAFGPRKELPRTPNMHQS
jgi:hypothetical protein